VRNEVVEIRRLSSGYWHARGHGPCNWAQWPVGVPLTDEHFFPEASRAFRAALERRSTTRINGRDARIQEGSHAE